MTRFNPPSPSLLSASFRSDSKGNVLELGVGTGNNLQYYPETVKKVLHSSLFTLLPHLSFYYTPSTHFRSQPSIFLVVCSSKRNRSLTLDQLNFWSKMHVIWRGYLSFTFLLLTSLLILLFFLRLLFCKLAPLPNPSFPLPPSSHFSQDSK